MQVYKALFKVIEKNTADYYIFNRFYRRVAVGLSNLAAIGRYEFTATKVGIAFINYDKSALAEGLENYLSKKYEYDRYTG